ncbi:hypothetical protein [Absidia glauca]|uniref:Uncharacterized protein n=1 Tax=Absidia glauca TaxID=4829 RepID=A0A163MAZ7_ABSGL|nr:hypothetical protein [Absidia glauca]
MRFTTLAVLATAMLMSVQAAPITARSGTTATASSADSGAGSLLLLPGLSDITSLLNLDNVLGLVQGLPDKVQTQVLSLVNDPEQLTTLIESLPSQLQTKLAGLPDELKQLPADVQTQLADLPSQLASLPAKLQTLVAQLPATLQAKLAALPSLIQGLPAQIEALPEALQAKLKDLPDLLTSKLQAGDLDAALKQVESLLSGVTGGKTGSVGDLPAKLEEQLTIVKTTLTQVTKVTSGVTSKVQETVTTLTGTVSSVTSTATVTVSQLKTVTGTAVSSVKDKIALPVKFVKDAASGVVDGTTTTKGKSGDVVQVVLSDLLTTSGVKVSALTDKVALPLDLVKTLKSVVPVANV